MESEDEVEATHAIPPAGSIHERRRAQKSVFDSWLSSAAVQEAFASSSHETTLKDVTDEELSMSAMMTKNNTRIIRNPRDYQLELFERAKNQNTIAVLDTGSGKTLIAVLLLRWIIDHELECRAAGEPRKISFFLVCSVTLVHQQFSVLQTNLDHNIEKTCGADHNWDKFKWKAVLAETKVVVCTADILLACLGSSWISMKQINLLIFDEAHHTKKNHAYAKIIKDFYLPESDVASRPRIFGMTASPIDSKSDVFKAASDLETLLDSKIATTKDMSFREFVSPPKEKALGYAALPRHFETDLLRDFKSKFGHIERFKKIFDRATQVARELGPWCVDKYLVDSFREKRLTRFELTTTRKFHAAGKEHIKELDSLHADMRSAIDFVGAQAKSDRKIQRCDLGSKVDQLHLLLKREFEKPSSHRCIVFVECRHTARLLHAVFQEVGTEHLRCAFLTGSNSNGDEDNFSYRDQILTLTRFRKGEINCLFATSVAEEGLDVPDCNLVVRFDLYKTMIQYVQSRGRARRQNSTFIHMFERENSIHAHLNEQVKGMELAMRSFCAALPEDRRMGGEEENLEALLSKEKSLPVHVEEVTGARLNYGNALACLARYVSSIPAPTEEPMHPTYVVTSRGSYFVAEVILPGNDPGVRSVIGQPRSQKTVAKRSAAFEACIKLRKIGHLDDHLMSTFQKRRKTMAKELLALSTQKKNLYPMRAKPEVWTHGRGTVPTRLWLTVVDFADGLERPHRPLLMLTRTMMPDMPTFPVFLNNRRESRVVSCSLSKPLFVDLETLQKLTTFTLRIYDHVFSKIFENDQAKFSYWLAPSSEILGLSAEDPPNLAVDWKLLDIVFESEQYKWTPQMPTAFLADKFISDRWDGSRKFYSIAVVPRLRPQDRVPQNTARAKFDGSILNYSVSLFKKARERREWDPNQPVFEAEKVLFRQNLLATPDAKEITAKKRAFLCPEPLVISTLPIPVVTSYFAWPAVIHRFESYLIALETCDLIGITCGPALALEAITKDSDNSGDWETDERINVQHGMGNNYERLEFLGDTFLKTATTIAVYIRNPNDDEADFHVKRMHLLCNNNLFNTAQELKLHEYIRSKAFSRRTWYPEGVKLLEGRGVNQKEEDAKRPQTLGDKTIADVCEALIGAAFLSHDKPGVAWHEEQWTNAVRAVTKLVKSPDHAMMKWNDYRREYQIPAYQTADATASQLDLAAKVQREHPYHFKYPRLLRSAFTHPSQPFTWEKVPSYQRLEFLGDALLDLASITHLFYRFPDKDPQWLTEHKMTMVSNKFLGAVCVNIGFHRHLRYSSSFLEHQIREYASELQEARQISRNRCNYWMTVSDPPKCLPDIVEAYVGAMFIDSDFDFNVVQKFFDRNMRWYFEDMAIYDTFANNHPVTRLYHLLDIAFGCQDYSLMAKEVYLPDAVEPGKKSIVAALVIHRKVIAHAKGESTKYSKMRAAASGLKELAGLVPAEFRGKVGCRCHQGKDNDEDKTGVEVSVQELAVAATSPLVDCSV